MKMSFDRRVAVLSTVAAIAAALFAAWQGYISERTLRLNERVWLSADGTGREDQNHYVRMNVRVHAYGQTPALDVHIHWSCFLVKDYDDPPGESNRVFADVPLKGAIVIAPGQNQEIGCAFPKEKDKEFWRGALKGSAGYRDVFGRKHNSDFCLVTAFNQAEAEMLPCPTGNFLD